MLIIRLVSLYIKSTEGASLLNPFYGKDYVAARAHGYKVGSILFLFYSTLLLLCRHANSLKIHMSNRVTCHLFLMLSLLKPKFRRWEAWMSFCPE